MNMANRSYQEQDFDYLQDTDRRDKKAPEVSRSRRASYARSSRPAVHNGIHRRRNKRFSW
jgi:hypothetical protein